MKEPVGGISWHKESSGLVKPDPGGMLKIIPEPLTENSSRVNRNLTVIKEACISQDKKKAFVRAEM